MTSCPRCQGRGWLPRNGWPVECDDCVPTKLVKGKVTLDKQRIAAIERAKKPEQTYAPKHYVGGGTVQYFDNEIEA